jgi:hypothetical protein
MQHKACFTVHGTIVVEYQQTDALTPIEQEKEK